MFKVPGSSLLAISRLLIGSAPGGGQPVADPLFVRGRFGGVGSYRSARKAFARFEHIGRDGIQREIEFRLTEGGRLSRRARRKEIGRALIAAGILKMKRRKPGKAA